MGGFAGSRLRRATQARIVVGTPGAHGAAMTHINSVDATAGQPMVLRVQTRRAELEARLTTLREDDLQTRSDIDLALATISELLTGDLENVPQVVTADMNRWLERNKHVAESASDVVAADAEPETLPVVENTGTHVRATD